MAIKRKILLCELNEVPMRVFSHFAEKHPDSNLANILPASTFAKTLTTDEGHLHPWTTWPTLHRGVNNLHHKIKDFGENLTDQNEQYPSIWDILAKAGIKVGVFGSIHSYPLPPNYRDFSFYLPDIFANSDECYPETLRPFHSFNLDMSRTSGRNSQIAIDKSKAISFALSCARLGVKPGTFASLAKQLLDEKSTPWKSTRRRSFQSVIAFDVFYKLFKKHKPDFTSFFSNHVASTMHRYWAATFPDDLNQENISNEWRSRFSGEIDFAMRKFDNMLGPLVKFTRDNPEYVLIVTSSMGQEAVPAKKVETELFLADAPKFLGALGFSTTACKPLATMHPQYNFEVSEDAAESFQQSLKLLSIDNNPISFRKKEHGFFSIDLGHNNLTSDNVALNGSTLSLEELGLEKRAIEEGASGTAYHTPEGSLIIYDPANSQRPDHQDIIDTRAFAPTILENFGVEVPSYMVEDRLPGF